MERNVPGKKFSKIWVYFARLSSVQEIFENAFPFTAGSCRKFRREVWVEWKAPIIAFSALTGTTKIFCSICLDNLQCRQPLGRTRNIAGILKITQTNPISVFSAKKCNACLLFGTFHKEKQYYLFRCPVSSRNFPKRALHLLSNGTFRNVLKNGKQPMSVSFAGKFSPKFPQRW